MDTICTFFEPALLNAKEGTNESVYNGYGGPLPFHAEDLQTRLTTFLEQQNKFVKITSCKITYTDAKQGYEYYKKISRQIPFWYYARWVYEYDIYIWYRQVRKRNPYTIHIVFEPYSAFLTPINSLYVNGSCYAPYEFDSSIHQ